MDLLYFLHPPSRALNLDQTKPDKIIERENLGYTHIEGFGISGIKALLNERVNDGTCCLIDSDQELLVRDVDLRFAMGSGDRETNTK